MTGPRAGRWIAATIAIVALLLGTLPIAGWIPGGLTDPAFSRRWTEWLLGLSICVGSGVVAALLLRGELGRRLSSALAVTDRQLPGSTLLADTVAALLCFVAYAITSKSVFGGKPLLIDEIVQVLQARMYADGRLSVPTDSARGFFSVLHMVDTGDLTYSQFPPGWAAMMALPSRFGAEWLVGPLCGAVAVLLFARLLRQVFPGAATRFVVTGALLFGLAPFPLFQFASQMSHGPVVMWLLAATLAVARLHATAFSAPGTALVAGFAAGCAFAVRPLDAMAFGVPMAAWVTWRCVQRSSWRVFVAHVAGAAVPLGAVMWVNASTTGSAFTFGYEALWGASHGLGFHAAPWGDAHTPARGLELLSMYVTRVNAYLFESPIPALLPAIGALLLIPRLSQVEWLLLCGSTLHALLYFAYWHDGFYLGPRFVLPWIPLVIILTLRAAKLAASDAAPRGFRHGLIGATLAAIVLSVAVALPARVTQYRSGLTSMRADYASEASRAGVSGAVVFVRESWGARIVARLWALGVSRSAAAALYSGVDACTLEHSISAIERGRARGAAAEDSLQPLLNNAARVQASSVSPDTTERMLPGAIYDAECTRRVMEDREGYALYPPFLLDRSSGNLYVRDLLAADSLLIDRFPGRRLFRVSRSGVDGTAPLVWSEVSRATVVAIR